MKRWLTMTVGSVCILAMLNGCFGSFGATRWLWKWNDSFSNKFVKTLIYWVFIIVPAYILFMFADFWIINLIEFYKGSNPICGDVNYEPTDDGSILATTSSGEQFKFTAVDDNRMIVEQDGVILGEVAVDANKQMIMTNYANGDVQSLDLSNVM